MSAVQGNYGGPEAVVTHLTHAAGNLPHTGVDLLTLGIGGGALFGVGILIRRLTHVS